MIFVPGLILCCMLVLLLASSRLQAAHAGSLLVATAIVDAVVVCSLAWSDWGYAISWDNDSVYMRQYGGRFLFRRHSFISVPFSDIHGIILHPPPRGVPTKYPLLELDTRSREHGPPLFIDPNYFKASSLAMFVNDLRERVPEMQRGPQVKITERLLRLCAIC